MSTSDGLPTGSERETVTVGRYVKVHGDLAPDDLCIIWSHEHGAWWRAEGHGYTVASLGAGVYTFADACKRVGGCGPEKGIEIRTVDDVLEGGHPDAGTVLELMLSRAALKVLHPALARYEAMFRAGEPMPGAHLRGDGFPCAYLHNGKVCNKCGFVAASPPEAEKRLWQKGVDMGAPPEASEEPEIYCKRCGSCGSPGCCPTSCDGGPDCLYPDTYAEWYHGLIMGPRAHLDEIAPVPPVEPEGDERS